MALGARSLRGAMGTYAIVAVIAVAALVLVLWLGGPQTPRAFVRLPADSPWAGAVLDDGQSDRAQFALKRGETGELPPGRYRLTLLSADGRSETRELVLPAGETRLGP